MIIDDKCTDDKLQYEYNREAAKISALSSGKIDKYEYLTGEDILPSDKIIQRIILKVLKNKMFWKRNLYCCSYTKWCVWKISKPNRWDW